MVSVNTVHKGGQHCCLKMDWRLNMLPFKVNEIGERTNNVSNECVNSSEQSTTYYYYFIYYLFIQLPPPQAKGGGRRCDGCHHRFAAARTRLF